VVAQTNTSPTISPGRTAASKGPAAAPSPALVGVDEVLPALDELDAVALPQVVRPVFRRGDDVPRGPAVGAGGFGLLGQQVEQVSGVDPPGKLGEVLEVDVGPEDRLARVED